MIDPFDETVGYGKIDEKADIVLVSHNHFDHSYTKGIKGDYTLVDAPGTYREDGVEITGVSLEHDGQQGKQRGHVTAFTIQAEGIRILHMSDVGAVPGESFFADAGKIDILMIPVGGVYTIDARAALQIMEKLSPNITIPMHYMTEVSKIQLKGVHEFTTLAGKEYDISRLGGSSLEITADNLKKRQRIFIMDFAN